MTNIYTPGQLGSALHRVLEKHKKELGKKDSKTKKVTWIKEEAFKIIHVLEKDMIKFNRENEKLKISPKELITILNTAISLIMKALEDHKKSK